LLTPFDDYLIHPSADPIAHPATGDPNHYDRYWFNGQDKGGEFFLAGAMGHYPVRGVVDANSECSTPSWTTLNAASTTPRTG